MTSKVLILDFGSQYTQLIARRVRENKVYCEILPCTASIENIRKYGAGALILSGGPNSIYGEHAPKVSKEILDLKIPTLGICYGMQWLVKNLGGEVEAGKVREYGAAEINLLKKEGLFSSLTDSKTKVWMSHGDHVTNLPSNFEVFAKSENGLLAAIGDSTRKLYALQFHPEVVHTPEGNKMLQNFLHNVAGLKGDWSMESFIDQKIVEIQRQVGDEHVLCAVSGGVDSSVMAVLLNKALGDKLHLFFVNNGLLRMNEAERVVTLFKKNLGIDINLIEATDRFLTKLDGIVDPERKRKIIGREFIAIFEEESKRLKNLKFLAQGTLYPDLIESVSFKGPSATIKSHHNVGGLPKNMKLELVEPFRELFKDEVREIGRLLDMPEEVIQRQPFPGPGLAVRVLGEIREERLRILREADDIAIGEIKKAGLYTKIWQSFTVLLPVKTVGVMGDSRTYENVIALRAVDSVDGMTAHWYKIPYEVLEKISNRIINEVPGVNRVVYDISSKPPATIEWE